MAFLKHFALVSIWVGKIFIFFRALQGPFWTFLKHFALVSFWVGKNLIYYILYIFLRSSKAFFGMFQKHFTFHLGGHSFFFGEAPQGPFLAYFKAL